MEAASCGSLSVSRTDTTPDALWISKEIGYWCEPIDSGSNAESAEHKTLTW